DFNGWHYEKGLIMELKKNQFKATLSLKSDANYQFRYILNGRHWFNDPQADGLVDSPFYGISNTLLVLEGSTPEPTAPKLTAAKKTVPAIKEATVEVPKVATPKVVAPKSTSPKASTKTAAAPKAESNTVAAPKALTKTSTAKSTTPKTPAKKVAAPKKA
nr:isoamylase early set domain-containing protein [Saprospiraceae bacterium]